MLRKSLLLHSAFVANVMGPRWTFWGRGQDGPMVSTLHALLARRAVADGTHQHRLLAMVHAKYAPLPEVRP